MFLKAGLQMTLCCVAALHTASMQGQSHAADAELATQSTRQTTRKSHDYQVMSITCCVLEGTLFPPIGGLQTQIVQNTQLLCSQI